MEDMQQLEHVARITSVYTENDKTVVELDETIFYPQGGGQPFDTGKIESETSQFLVEEVRFVDGIVKHIGNFISGKLVVSEEVHLHVDAERRKLHMRLHSAAHVVDMAIHKLGLEWIPGKGYHFPDGPYVEYDGKLDDNEDRDILIKKIEDIGNAYIGEGLNTSIQFMPKSEMHTVCHHVPDYLPDGKPTRVVLYGSFGVPCGGTHVSNLKDIGSLIIRKVSTKKGVIRVSYAIA